MLRRDDHNGQLGELQHFYSSVEPVSDRILYIGHGIFSGGFCGERPFLGMRRDLCFCHE